jgi:TPR repeat protein
MTAMQTKNIDQLFEHAYQLHKSGNDVAAFSAYLELAEQGYSNCQAFVGGAYYAGKGVEQDMLKARLWLERAVVEDDEVEALFLLGKLSAHEGDYRKAFSWYEKAALQDYAPAIYKMAIYNEKGRLGSRDIKAAMVLYQHAAEAGHLYAQRTLAFRLFRGWGGMIGFFGGFVWLYRMMRNGYRLGMEEDDLESCDGLRV